MAEFLVTMSRLVRNQRFDAKTVVVVAGNSAKRHFTVPHPALTRHVVKLGPPALHHKERQRIIDIHFCNLYVTIFGLLECPLLEVSEVFNPVYTVIQKEV